MCEQGAPPKMQKDNLRVGPTTRIGIREIPETLRLTSYALIV